MEFSFFFFSSEEKYFKFTDLSVKIWSFPADALVKNLPANAGDRRDEGSNPVSGRSPGGGTGNPLQYSCLGNPMDRGAWWATAHEIAKSWTQLSAHTYTMKIYDRK